MRPPPNSTPLARAIGVAMDVANEEQVNAGIAESIARFGVLDVLVSNAGVQIVDPIVDFEFARWKKLLAIQLDRAFLITRAALRTSKTAAASSTWARCTRRKARC